MSRKAITDFRPPVLAHIRAALDLRNRILYDNDGPKDGNFSGFWTDGISGYVALMIFGGVDKNLISEVLDAWFAGEVNPAAGYLKAQNQPDNVGEAMLELYWHYFDVKRPENVPWPAWDAAKINEWRRKKSERDPDNVGFWKAFSETDWIPATCQRERQARGEKAIVIDENFDVHSWKESNDPWICSVCVRLLCKPVNGELPTTDNIMEAGWAMRKLYLEIPRRVNPDNPEETLPHGDVVSFRDTFLLTWHLGRKKGAAHTLRIAAGWDDNVTQSWLQEFSLYDFVDLPQVYELLAEQEKESGRPSLSMLSEDDIKESGSLLLEALKLRASEGKQEPFKNHSWEELLRRFSEAIFVTEKKDYKHCEKPPEKPADLLLPPLTASEVDQVEQTLGPIPPDIKEMSLVSRGFKGGWHFAGGGFPCIKCFEPSPWKDDELYIDELQSFKETIVSPYQLPYPTKSGKPWMTQAFPKELDFGTFYKAGGGWEADGYYHIIVPPDSWKKIKKGDVKEGEYKYFNYANWTAGIQDEAPSVRKWMEYMTTMAEAQIFTTEYEKTYAQKHGIEWKAASVEDEDEEDGEGED